MTAHICVKCGGQLTLTNSGGSEAVSVGYVSLRPGAWGRYKGTSARLESVQALEKMGVKLIRSGGSVACDPTMAWTSWCGNAFIGAIYAQNRIFTKTGSGQT
jgi:hypothetical protein